MTAFTPNTSGKKTFTGNVPDGTCYSNEDFSGCTFFDVGAKKCIFISCKFNYCTFERSYFRQATFDGCEFHGARFRDSNFRDAVFKGRCVLNYATFAGTIVPFEQMLANQPPFPNLKLDFARTLRANFSGLGMHMEAQKFFDVELAAEDTHYLKIIEGSESYYSERWPTWFKRAPYRLTKAMHQLEDFVWGHGASPARLARTTLIGIAVLSVAFLYIGTDYGGREFKTDPFGAIGDSIYYTLLTFFSSGDTNFRPVSLISKVFTVATLLYGYLTLGLFVSAMYRRLARV